MPDPFPSILPPDLIGAPFIISDPEAVDMAGLDMMVGMVSAEFWSSSKGHFLRCELISNSPIKEWLEGIKDQVSQPIRFIGIAE